MTAESDAIVIDQHLTRADYFRLLMLMTLRKWYVILLILAGIISGGLVVALLARRARHESDMQNQRLLQLTREVGYDVPDLPPLFNWIERKGLSYLTQAINFLGIISQFCFAIGAVWGLMWI